MAISNHKRSVQKSADTRTAISVFLCCILPAGFAAADDGVTALPDPLTLEQALSFASGSQPALEKQRAELALAQANAAATAATDDLSARVDLYARWVQPAPLAPDQRQQDHQASFIVNKPLLDFGRSSALQDAAQAGVDAQSAMLTDTLGKFRIDIMQAFFDVVLADLRFARENEDMATAFIRFDRTRQRQSLGQRSELETRETRAAYEQVRRARYTAETQQRITRNRLALLLGHGDNLPANVTPPQINLDVKTMPEYADLLQSALAGNPQLQGARAAVAGAQQRLLAAQRDYWPSVDAEAEVSEYHRQFGGRDDWRAGVKVTVPLYSGGRISAKIAQEQARLHGLQAQAALLEQELRQQLLEIWLQIYVLGAERDRAKANYVYQQQRLDEARMLYEQEKKADLGDTMVQTSDARWQVARSDFALAISWAKIQALTGQTINIEQGFQHDNAK